MSSDGNLIVLSAPSGSGKTSLAGRLIQELAGLQFSVSHTTRKRRKGEREGEDYFFVGEPEFEVMIEEDAFLEYAHVYGNYYGTSRAAVVSALSEGIDVLLDIDVQGALKVRKGMPDAVMIFVLPPSYEVLEERLRKRGLDDPEVIEARLKIARDEIEYYRQYDYVIINSDLDDSVESLKAIVTGARYRVSKKLNEAEAIVETFRS